MQFTQSAIVLENLINKLFANFAGNKDSSAARTGSEQRSGARIGQEGFRRNPSEATHAT